ncbi:hypothetical protein N0V93_004659 [Gnomoniopsis smithogilvyi]|uniref:Uncharacterized protein n=1 Tax=Gnomoniopsis smithogilvyi TaxID=1191159 RepID=A0A9W8YU39_9PEZI|nr:hypothetical protein N0V93_004659 [Gnomoniopsis smithogilvyi]
MHALLNPRLKLWIHIVEICFILPIIILTIVRLTMGMSFSGGGRMGLAFGIKSLVFIAYQLLTDHVRALQRWRSLKIYAIINGAEIVFWVAVVYLVAAANIQMTCTGTICALGWVEVVLAIFMTLLSTWVFLICYFDFKQYRANGNSYEKECALPKTTQGMSTTMSVNSERSSLDAQQPMIVKEQPQVNYAAGNYGVEHNSEEYHSGYARNNSTSAV